MSTLYKNLKFLWPDEWSDWENKQERLSIDATNELEDYYLTDQGRLSMDPEEARKALLRFAQQNKKHPQVGHQLGIVQAGILMQRYVWRRLDSVSAARYEFIEPANGLSTLVAAERFTSTITCQDGLEGIHSPLGNAVKVITRDDLARIPTSSRQSKHMTTNLKELCDGR